jgi:xanthine phosphoribosyltransferase
MELLQERIRAEGRVLPGNILDVGSFLNQQIDIRLYTEMGREFARLFADAGVTRVLTVEASGIVAAMMAAQYLTAPGGSGPVPLVFARKFRGKNISGDVYSATVSSYTHGIDYPITVQRPYIKAGDRVLLVDDFLANGCALEGLVELVHQAGADVVGAGIVIEKGFQSGGKRLRSKGIRIESLAIIEGMSPEGGVIFAKT